VDGECGATLANTYRSHEKRKLPIHVPVIGHKGFGPNPVQMRFSPVIRSLNADLDLAFGSAISLNFDPNLGPVQVGSGSNHSSEPNIGITTLAVRANFPNFYIHLHLRCPAASPIHTYQWNTTQIGMWNAAVKRHFRGIPDLDCSSNGRKRAACF